MEGNSFIYPTYKLTDRVSQSLTVSATYQGHLGEEHRTGLFPPRSFYSWKIFLKFIPCTNHLKEMSCFFYHLWILTINLSYDSSAVTMNGNVHKSLWYKNSECTLTDWLLKSLGMFMVYFSLFIFCQVSNCYLSHVSAHQLRAVPYSLITGISN
jgi:hypothetical protein